MMTDIEKIRFHQHCSVMGRAKNLKLIPNPNCNDMFALAIDLEYANRNGKKLDFENLLKFDDKNFTHDILGISAHIIRDGLNIGLMTDCFEPRCGWMK